MDDCLLTQAAATERRMIWNLWHACAQETETRWNDAYPTPALLDADLAGGCLYAMRYHYAITGSVTLQAADSLQGQGYPFAPCAKPVMLTRLCILPVLWRQGLGSALLAMAEQRAREGGADCVQLLCDVNNAAGLALFARAGYARVCRTEQAGDALAVLEKLLHP